MLHPIASTQPSLRAVACSPFARFTICSVARQLRGALLGTPPHMAVRGTARPMYLASRNHASHSSASQHPASAQHSASGSVSRTARRDPGAADSDLEFELGTCARSAATCAAPAAATAAEGPAIMTGPVLSSPSRSSGAGGQGGSSVGAAGSSTAVGDAATGTAASGAAVSSTRTAALHTGQQPEDEPALQQHFGAPMNLTHSSPTSTALGSNLDGSGAMAEQLEQLPLSQLRGAPQYGDQASQAPLAATTTTSAGSSAAAERQGAAGAAAASSRGGGHAAHALSPHAPPMSPMRAPPSHPCGSPAPSPKPTAGECYCSACHA